MNISRPAFALIIALTSACTYMRLHTTENHAPAEMEAKTIRLVPGESSRGDIHGLLGEPLAATRDGRIEVFRAATDESVEFGTFVLLPLIPIPVVGPANQVDCYLMVEFDNDERLSDARSGCDQGSDELSIRIGDIEFMVVHTFGDLRRPEPISERALIEPAPRSLPPTPAGHCRILFAGLPRSNAGHSIEVRDQFKFGYGPLALEGLVQRFIPAGHHRARVGLSHRVWSDRQVLEAEFSCVEGETVVLSDTVDFAWIKHQAETGMLDPSLDGLAGGLLVEPFNESPVDKQKILTHYHSE